MEVSSKIIRWGILGCGKIAHKFAQDLLTVPNAKLEAVASRNEQKSREFGRKYHSNKCYDSYVALCLDVRIDVIYIATPHSFHYKHTLLCLNHKKAVLCEKPFAMNAIQVAEMIAAAKQNNVFLMEAMWTFFLPHYQYVLHLIQSGELGTVTSIKSDFGYQFDFDSESRIYNKKLGGGSLLDIGIYPVFTALSMLGVPDAIKAKAKMTHTDVDESCSIEFKYTTGATATLFSSLIEETKTEAIIRFEKGTVQIHGRFHEPTTLTIITKDNKETKSFDVATNGYSFEAAHVTALLLNNKKESSIMTFDKSLQLIQLLDLIRSQIGLVYH